MGPKVIVIGAGWAGLSAAKTYIRINPEVDLTILDDDTSLGGVWSSSRLYPGLLADSPRGLFQYSDLSMLDEDVVADSRKRKRSWDELAVRAMGEKEARSSDRREKYGVIRGQEVHNYLYKYAEKGDLVRRIRFQSRVVKAERYRLGGNADPNGWRLTLSSGETMDCDKLIVASGLFSQSSIPDVPGLDTFGGLSMHSKLLGPQHKRLCNPDIKSVVVIGGCKSALEAMNLCLALPNRPQIHWIVRRNEHGVPILINHPSIPIPLLASNNRRLFAAFSPSVFDTQSFLYRFLHSGQYWLGVWLCAIFWRLLAWVLLRIADYDRSEQGKMIKFEPDKVFRSLHHICLIQKGNPVLEEIHKGERIKVHIGELEHISRSSICITPHNNANAHLTTEHEQIQTDAIVWCTGWKSSTSFFNDSEASNLGLPVPISSQDPSTRDHWQKLHSAADAELLQSLPALRNWPIELSKQDTTNYRMYRQILSPKLLARNDRSIIFTGFVTNTQTAFASELTGLWGVAWMEALLQREDLPNEAEMERNVAKTHAWMARRYGSRGNTQPELIMEIQSYFDQLVKDLSCQTRRKGGLKEWLGVYSAADYKGLVDEVIEKARKKQ